MLATHLLMPASGSLTQARRLVVLVSDPDVDESELARHIWLLASPRGLRVLYVGGIADRVAEPFVRQRLATLAALTHDNRTTVETHVQDDRDWLRIAQRIWQPGDQFVCLAGQVVSGRGRAQQPLGQAIVSALGVPVYLLAGIRSHARPRPSKQRPHFVIDWIVLFTVVIGFFALQVSIQQLAEDWARVTLLCLSVLVEAGFIGIWNQLWTE